MDRLAAMAAFAAVVDATGFAPAARRLKLSPSMVTRLVAGLEEQLGIRLLQRTTRRVTLTDAGARFLEHARRILTEVKEAEASAAQERAEPTGKLVVTAPMLFGRMHVAPLLSIYLKRHPGVSAELLLTDRVMNLVDEGVDVALRIGAIAPSSLVIRSVGATRRVVVAAPDYLKAHGRLASPRDLTRHRVIAFSGLTPTTDWRFELRGRPRHVSVAPTFTTNSVDVAIGHAIEGGGVLVALAYQVLEPLRTGALRIVLKRFEPPPLPIRLAFPTSRLLSPKVRAFVDLVTEAPRWEFVSLP
jgi:DNA-binding transcriptional LysR family regulator